MTLTKYFVAGLVGLVLGVVAISLSSVEEGRGGVYETTASYVPGLFISPSNGTSSVSLEKACITMKTSSGGTVYWYASATGNLATSSTSCN